MQFDVQAMRRASSKLAKLLVDEFFETTIDGDWWRDVVMDEVAELGYELTDENEEQAREFEDAEEMLEVWALRRFASLVHVRLLDRGLKEPKAKGGKV